MLKNTRDPELALWQSAVDEVVAKKSSGAQAQDIASGRVIARPDTTQDLVAAAALDVEAAELGKDTAMPPPTKSAAEDVGSVARYCSTLVRKSVVDLVKGNPTAASIDRQQLTAKMGDCDPRWVEPALKYAEFLLKRQAVPYKVYSDIGDFVLPMNDTCRIGIIGDWGTGQDAAKTVLAQMARKKPDIAIHLGDIYYSCTDFEATNYFYNIWKKTLGDTRTFTLAGNHDMFSGGAPYYDLLAKFGQPASYFCLRNENFQIIGLDTGLNDRQPGGTEPTFLQDTEVAWLKDKIQTAGKRQTILLSHHQLFSAWESIAGQSVNPKLQAQVQDILPKVALWLWGHEHNQVIYGRWAGVLARCIGHGAFPIGATELGTDVKYKDVPIVANTGLGVDADGIFMRHGYAVIELNGKAATISYYDDQDEDTPVYQEKLEEQQAAGGSQV
jgi:predicted phosphodiesterase